MIQFKALLAKELKEAFRDKRALMVALSIALLAPVMIMVMSKTMIKDFIENPPVYVHIEGAEHAPKLIKALADENILSYAEAPEEDQRFWQKQKVELIIPDNYAQHLLEGKGIDIIVRSDYSEKSLSAPLRRIRGAIRDYSMAIGYKRLLVRGVDVKLLRPINIQEQDTSLPSSNAMVVTMMLGLYLLMGVFISGQSIAIDASAGERERNVLELLLCQPVNTMQIVMAKLLCASIVSIVAVVLMLVLTMGTMSFVDLTKIGATFSLDVSTFMVLLLILIPLCLLASALQLFFSFQAKSFKEAQSTVAMLIMIPAMVPLAMMLIDNKPAWVEWVPISGQSLIIEDLFKGLAIDWAALIVSTGATLALLAVLVSVLAMRLKSEKVIQSLG